MKVSIVIPVFNEERRLSNCLNNLLKYAQDNNVFSEIIVSADGCTDNSVNIAKDFARRFAQIKLVSTKNRLGKGGGILKALKFASGDTVVIFDCDMAVDPKAISNFLSKMEEKRADIVLGSRNLPSSIISVKPPFIRRIAGKVFNMIFRILFRIDIYDTQCGFKVIKKNVLDSLSKDIFVRGYAFDAEMIIKAKSKGYIVVETPVTWRFTYDSKVNILREIFVMGKDLILMFLRHRMRK